MNYKLLSILFISVLLLTVVSARVEITRPGAGVGTVNVYTGNLTNVSQMEDVHVPTPTDGYVFTWNSTTGVWEDQAAGTANNASVNNFIIDVNNSMNNYVVNYTLGMNNSINNYILWVNSTNFQVEADPMWTANWTNVAFTNINETFDENLIVTKNLTVNGTTFFVNSNNERVGIGTIDPKRPLHMVGNGTSNSGWARFGISTTEYTEIGHRGANSAINAVGDGDLDFRHDGSNVMELSDTGNLNVIGNVTADWGIFDHINATGAIHLLSDRELYFGDDDDSIFYQSLDNDFHFAGTGITYLTTSEGLFNFTGSNIDMFEGNVTANYFFGNGSQLTDISITETDPLAYNGTLTTGTYVDTQNTSQNNYIVNYTGEINNSVANYILYVNGTNFQVDTDTWVANYSLYYTKTEVDAINTSVSNTIQTDNSSMNNYINSNNVSVSNTIQTDNSSMNNYITENNNSVNYNIDSKLTVTYFNASAVQNITGTSAGDLANIQTKNEITYNVTESNSDYELRVNFTGITNFTTLLIRHKCSVDAGHIAAIQIWDYTNSRWEGLGYLTESITSEMKTLGVYNGVDHISGGVVQVRFYQDEVGGASHIHQFDWVSLSKGFGTPVGEEIDPLSIHTDGNTSLNGNWDQGAFNLTNVASWFLGLLPWTNIPELNTTINSLILINNGSVENYILENNNSVQNTIQTDNSSVNNYILWVNSTNFQVETDPMWTANWTSYYTKTESNALNTSVTNYILENNNSVQNTIQTDNSSMTNFVTSNNASMVPYNGADKNVNISNNNFSIGGTTMWWNGTYLIWD